MPKPPSTRRRFPKSSAKRQQVNLWGKDTLLIERMSQEGRGIANRKGKIVFVSDALTGEQVRVQCTMVKRDYSTADMIELLADSPPSAQRVHPECPVYEECGGCSLQHWSPTAQLQHKQENLLTLLQPIAPTMTLDPAITSPSTGFRHRLRLIVNRKSDNRYLLGLRQRGSHDAVNIQNCLVANTAVNAMLQALPDRLYAAPELQGLREIEIDADSNNRIGLCFYFAAHPGEKVLSALCTAVLSEPIVAIRARLTTRKKIHTQAGRDDTDKEDLGSWKELRAEGELSLRLNLMNSHDGAVLDELCLAYLPGDFTQTHWEVNRELVSRALEWLQPNDNESALDLFSGIGNFALPLARHTKLVHAMEGDNSMSLRVAGNAKRNGIDNIRATTLNLLGDTVALPRADLAIIDPPRAGAKAVCETIARSKLRQLVYISCHPATLVRDARILHSGGFRLTKAAAVDMFPHTGHSEAISLFERK